MSSAFDFSIVPGPAPQTLVDVGAKGILVYSFAFRQSDAYLDECRARGLKVAWVWERNTDSIFGGYDYAVNECRYHESRIKPGEVTYVACDTNDGGVAGRDLSPFLRGWSDTTREAEFGLYGSSGAIRQGQAFGGKLTRFWGVVNWINGGYSNNDPRNVDYWRNAGVHLIQMIGSPIPNTDENLIMQDNWWSIGTPSTPAIPTSEEDDASMYPRIWTTGHDAWYLTFLSQNHGGRRVKRVVNGDEANRWRLESLYGHVPHLFADDQFTPYVVPQAALDVCPDVA